MGLGFNKPKDFFEDSKYEESISELAIILGPACLDEMGAIAGHAPVQGPNLSWRGAIAGGGEQYLVRGAIAGGLER